MRGSGRSLRTITPGRASTARTIKQLILHLDRNNSTWGHRRTQGELARLGYPIAPSTLWEILHTAGIAPAPQHSGPTWHQFLTAQAHRILAADFLHLDCTFTLKRQYALIFIEHSTHQVHLATSPPTPPVNGRFSRPGTSPWHWTAARARYVSSCGTETASTPPLSTPPSRPTT
ncbi:hypothetical protein [Streptomyces sp. NBC_01361]|uniref:hypothetical protein n=1 Tax=Streptomyces sp. NBC_01361 TaxID=2903838 RepID=UPI002E37C83F|nr:hypothetical protein [Streptomyces sp. NBC_01361]